jgi:hypothetical protein
VALTAFPTLFVEYAYSYSLDVFGAFALVAAYAVTVRKRFLWAGAVWGFAVLARLSNLATGVGFAAFLILAGWRALRASTDARSKWRSATMPLGRFVLGGAPAAACLLLGNWRMFGSPFVTSYDRWQHFTESGAVIKSQAAAFACPFWERLPGILFESQSGLLVGGPLLAIAAAYGFRSFWREAREEAVLMSLICASSVVFFTKYCLAFPSSPGNRYLMAVVALGAIPLALSLRNAFAVETSAHGGPPKRMKDVARRA